MSLRARPLTTMTRLWKTQRCKGCGICVAFCPKKVLQLDVLNHCQIVNADACIGCGQCELRCPDYAIFVDKEEN